MARAPLASTALALTLVLSAAAGSLPASSPQSALVIHQKGTKLYHRPGCAAIADATDVLAMTRAQAESRGYKAHEVCDRDEAATADGKPAAPVKVFVDGSRYYHRVADCSRVDKAASAKNAVKEIALEEAGKSRWPCPACKPPIRKKSAEPAVPGTGRRGG